MAMRIPITMCHGLVDDEAKPLTVGHFEDYFRIARDMGFTSITYDELAKWRAGEADLPPRPVMFDFDHPVISIHRDIVEQCCRARGQGPVPLRMAVGLP
jgi:hypothetical protein